MRNVIVARDGNGQTAGAEVIEAGGNAVDAVLAAMLVGACMAGPAELLGSAVVLVAGVGNGQWMVDGRARAPGLDAKRGSTPAEVPEHWRAAVPGLPTGVLVAQNRFGAVTLGTIVRAVGVAVREATDDSVVRQRLNFLEELYRHGIRALERVGVWQKVHEELGPVVQGPFSRADMQPFTAELLELQALGSHGDEVLLAPETKVSSRNPAPKPERFPVDAALAADMHGTVACAYWLRAPEALALGGDTGLGLAGLCPLPRKGVTRQRPGEALEMPVPGMLLRQEGRAWAGLALTGEGALEQHRNRWLRQHFATRPHLLAGLPEYPEAQPSWARGTLLWLVREGDQVRAHTEGVGDGS